MPKRSGSTAVVVLGVVAASAASLVLRSVPSCAAWSLRARASVVLLAAYLPGFLDGSEYQVAPRRNLTGSAIIRFFWRRAVPWLFNITPQDLNIESPDALAGCEQYIMAVHPHGVLSLGHLVSVVGFFPALEQVAPQARRSALAAGVLFKIPYWREVLLCLGCVDAGRKTASMCLQDGLSLSVVPGGEREQLIAQRGKKEQVLLKERKGFVGLALRHGVPLVPVYVFGEAQLYRQSSLLFGLRSWLQRTLGVALCLPHGPFGLPLVPFRPPMRFVVGTPIEMPKIPEPTKAQISEHHARYCAELEKLFLRHRVLAGHAQLELELI